MSHGREVVQNHCRDLFICFFFKRSRFLSLFGIFVGVCTIDNIVVDSARTPTPPAMTAAMEAMEKLLHEADSKFDEKLRLCQQGVATNMNIYSDRSYNLRQQIAHNPQLTGDDHFMEMLADTERCLAPEFTVKGELDKKLHSLLCGLLKTLLRETTGQAVYSLRKIQIEMIWQWYHDKKAQVLDFAIAKERERMGSQSVSSERLPESPAAIKGAQESETAQEASGGATSSSGIPVKLEQVLQGQWGNSRERPKTDLKLPNEGLPSKNMLVLSSKPLGAIAVVSSLPSTPFSRPT